MLMKKNTIKEDGLRNHSGSSSFIINIKYSNPVKQSVIKPYSVYKFIHCMVL